MRGRKNSERGVFWMTSKLPASTPTSRRLQPRTRGNGAGRRNKGPERFICEIDHCRESQAGLRHAVVGPNVTGRTKDRIAQIKLARAGSFTIAD